MANRRRARLIKRENRAPIRRSRSTRRPVRVVRGERVGRWEFLHKSHYIRSFVWLVLSSVGVTVVVVTVVGLVMFVLMMVVVVRSKMTFH